MKLGFLFIFILVVAGVFFSYNMMISEVEEDTGIIINNSELQQYDYVTQINETIDPLKSKLSDIADPDNGWWTKITSGITALPYVVMLIPQAIFSGFIYGGYIFTGIFTYFNIETYLILIGLLMLLVYIIFKLIDFYNGRDKLT